MVLWIHLEIVAALSCWLALNILVKEINNPWLVDTDLGQMWKPRLWWPSGCIRITSAAHVDFRFWQTPFPRSGNGKTDTGHPLPVLCLSESETKLGELSCSIVDCGKHVNCLIPHRSNARVDRNVGWRLHSVFTGQCCRDNQSRPGMCLPLNTMLWLCNHKKGLLSDAAEKGNMSPPPPLVDIGHHQAGIVCSNHKLVAWQQLSPVLEGQRNHLHLQTVDVEVALTISHWQQHVKHPCWTAS